MTIKERLAILETEMKQLKRLLYILIFSTLGNGVANIGGLL